MENFTNLPEKKRQKIINAALKVFGTHNYKKASVSDIAAEAGISKAMVFHYFGTKKDMYLYLVRFCSDILISEIKSNFDETVTDFFERIILASDIKIAVMKQYAAIPAFLTNIYFEEDPIVKNDVQKILAEGEVYRNHIAFDGMDVSKFKEDVDVTLVMKMLIWMAEGFAKEFSAHNYTDLEARCQEYYRCMDILKSNLYK
ncbi:MAG: transcriptional regulator, TetR family [Anaerocolumna sp.]|jgi:AcrR family transcriptional regulator|nr:transcriptional regulator, TetR family [Anaerocolumna sp.]